MPESKEKANKGFSWAGMMSKGFKGLLKTTGR
jgi:hypothetical protein